MNEAASHLARAITLLSAGQQLPPDVSGWLLSGLTAYRGGADLESALGLRSAPGKRSARDIARLAQRDGYIQALTHGQSGGAWDQAVRISGWIRQYAAEREYPQRPLMVRSLDDGGIPSLARGLLSLLFQHDPAPPRSASQVYRILLKKRSD